MKDNKKDKITFSCFNIVYDGMFFSCSSKKNHTQESLSKVDTISNSNEDSVYSVIKPEKLDIDSYLNFDTHYAFKYDKLNFIVGGYINTPVDLAENELYGYKLLALD